MTGRLYAIVQQHLDDYGVTEAEFARRIGTSPQTVNSWKQRGVRSLPDKQLLVGVSDVTRRPYDEVLSAALHDAGYLPKPLRKVTAKQTRTARTDPRRRPPGEPEPGPSTSSGR